MDITILENGRLRLSIESISQEDLQDLKGRAQEVNELAFLGELMEPYSTNGGFTPFDAGEGNPFVGLTDAPCIAESLQVADDGAQTVEGRVWWFPDYAIKSPVAELLEKGSVEFPLGIDAEPSVATTLSRKAPGF